MTVVGRSGQVVASGAPTASGDLQQTMGVSTSVSGALLAVGDALEGVAAGSGDIGSGAVTGQAGGGYFCVASGTLGSFDITSGAKVSRANQLVDEYATEERISGFKAVSLNSGNNIVLAMAGSGLRLPVVGIVASNYESGQTAVVILAGKARVPVANLDANWSGKAGQHLYVGSGGHIQAQSLMVSGQGWQRLGTAFSGGMIVDIDLTILSGGYTTPPGLY